VVKWSYRCQFRAPRDGYVNWSWVLPGPVTGSTRWVRQVVLGPTRSGYRPHAVPSSGNGQPFFFFSTPGYI
jgi:hypothetical protein